MDAVKLVLCVLCVAGFMVSAHKAEIIEAARQLEATEPKKDEDKGKKEKTD